MVLRGSRLPGFSGCLPGFPVFWQEGVDFGVFHARHAGEEVGEVFLGVDSPSAAALNDGIDDGTSPAGIGMSYEEPAASADAGGPDRVFAKVSVASARVRNFWG